MQITFDNNRDMKCYENFVKNPLDRTYRRKFWKVFSDEIADEAVKRYDLMKKFPSASDYNQVYGASDNRIEIKRGTKDKEPLVFKVRISRSYRKFFYMIAQSGTDLYLRKQEWVGQFNELTNVHIFEVNKHEY